jgi:TolB-like protein/tetratricopeptide (TPR) repeat protein
MASPNGGAALVRFGPFEFDTRTSELRKSGRAVRLAPQPARLLGALLERAGEMVTREEVRQALWSADTFVDVDAGLNYCLGRLRAVLGDSVQAPRFIETLSKRGYRFVAAVERIGQRPRTLAVLPFDNLGGDPAEQYFSDGVADGLITELGKIASLRVISRQSVLHFKGSRLSIGDIARQLHADTLVEGSVLHHGDCLRITAQLIEADPERHLWAESYDGNPQEFMTLLARVARAVASAISGVLTPEDDAGSHVPGASPDAQTAFLKARFHLGKWSGPEIQRGLACLHEAIAADAGHAPSYAALAHCLMMLGYWGHAPWQEAYQRAKEAAVKATELDPTLSAAHAALAFASLLYDWDFRQTESSVRRALETGPSNEMAYLVDALYQSWIRGDHEAALAAGSAALAIDPVSAFTNSTVAWLYLFAHRYEEAAEQAARTLQMYQDALQALVVLGWTGVTGGDVAAAIPMFEEAAARSPDPITLGFLGHVYGRAGRKAEAQVILDRLTAGFTSHRCVKSIVSVYAGLGDTDSAFEWLERGLAVRDGGLLALRVSPPFDPLASDPRFEKLASRIRLRRPGRAPRASSRVR